MSIQKQIFITANSYARSQSKLKFFIVFISKHIYDKYSLYDKDIFSMGGGRQHKNNAIAFLRESTILYL